MIRISGRTRVLVVIGDPVAHSLSPAMHNAAITALGLDAIYVPLRTPASGLAHILRAFDVAQVAGNVTVPHKISAAQLIVRQTEPAKALGAINTFWSDGERLVGDNTDVAGISEAMDALDVGGPWVLAGTGGSARAVAAAACTAGAELLVRSREHTRARDFVTWCRNVGAVARIDDGAPAQAAINATPLGLREDDPDPIPLDRLSDCRGALDLVYKKGETPWCRRCRDRGMRALDGRIVLVAQGARAFERFFPDQRAPRAVMSGVVNQMLET